MLATENALSTLCTNRDCHERLLSLICKFET